MAIAISGTTLTFNDNTTQTTASVVNTTNVLNATAGLTAGAVGTYAMVGDRPGAGNPSNFNFGSNYSAGTAQGQLSALALLWGYSDDAGTFAVAASTSGGPYLATISGTWKYLGANNNINAAYFHQMAIAVRVA